MANEHSALIKFILDTHRAPPFLGRCWLRKNQSGRIKIGSRYIDLGEAGWSDVIGFDYMGRFVSLEIKVGRDKLSGVQRAFRDKVVATPLGIWYEIRSEAEALAALEIITK